MITLDELTPGIVHHWSTDDGIDVYVVDLQEEYDPDGEHAVVYVIVQPLSGAPWIYTPPSHRALAVYEMEDLVFEAIEAYQREHERRRLRLVRGGVS